MLRQVLSDDICESVEWGEKDMSAQSACGGERTGEVTVDVSHAVMLDVMLDTNDPLNGDFAGRFSNLEIADAIYLEGVPTEVLLLKGPTGYLLAIGAERFTVSKHARWPGNWCWDMFTMPADVATRLINFLRGKGWVCTQAESGLYQAYEQRELRPEEIIEVVQAPEAPF